MKSTLNQGCVKGGALCVVSIIGADKESWKAVRLEFHAERHIGYKVHMRDAIAQYPSDQMCTVQPYNVKLYGIKAAKPLFKGTLDEVIRHMSKS